MPGRDTSVAMAALDSTRVSGKPSKSHRPIYPEEDEQKHGKERVSRRAPEEIKKRNRSAYVTDDRLNSWISDRTQSNGTGQAPVQPLTPPINIKETFQSWLDDNTLLHSGVARGTDVSGQTPLVQQSPPTPETTPPRKVHKSSAVDTFPLSHHSSDSLEKPFGDQTESRTDSFKTARENLSSDDEENLSDDSPLLSASRQRWLRDTGLSQSGGIGLGLGLESDEEQPPTPKQPVPRYPSSKTQDFGYFDGIWGSDSQSNKDDTESQATAFRDPEVGGAIQSSISENGFEQDSPTLGMDSLMLPKGQNVSQRISEEEENTKAIRRKDFKSQNVGQKTHRSKSIDTGADSEGRQRSDNRLSQASTSSTIVEAVVIDSTPQRQRTLRHTGRIVSLDHAASSHSSGREREIAAHDRLAPNIKSPSKGIREHISSEMSSSKPGASVDRSNRATICVVPDRRSSLRSSRRRDKRDSRTVSAAPKAQAMRPTTAPEDSVGYFDVAHRERKAMSVILQPAKPLRSDAFAEKTLSSPVTTDTPPAAGDANRVLSTSTSVTSGGLRTHYIPQTPSDEDIGGPQSKEARESHVMETRRSHSGDWTNSRNRSALVTPFSLRSAHSSTPGTLEVNEATAVNIYPHTNESILVIQEMAGKESGSPKEQPTIIADNADVAFPGSASSYGLYANSDGITRRELSDVPLENPRNPPKPPDFKLIPPTPANAASSSEDTIDKSKKDRRAKRLSSGLSSLKRSLSARRYSETIVSPFTRTLSLRNGNVRRRPYASENKDSKLHPLWRPRTFWDGSDSDSDSEFGNDGVLPAQRTVSHSGPRRSMSLTRRFTGSLRNASIPRLRRASSAAQSRMPDYNVHVSADAGGRPTRSMSLTRKLGGSLRIPHSRRSKRFTTGEWHNQPNYEFIRPESDHEAAIPRGGYQVQFIGFRGLAERLERRRVIREEDKREERRNWLRGRIGIVGPKDVTDFDIIYPVRNTAHDRKLIVDDEEADWRGLM